MSTQDPTVPARVIDHSKPLARLQEYLVAARSCMVLIQDLLLALKDMLFTAALIISFIWMAVYLITGMHGTSRESMMQTAVNAQTTGSITGRVTDQNGAVVAGATVTLSNVATGDARSALTDGNGNFTFQALLPGTYTITVAAKGFRKSTARNIVISVSLNTQVIVQLQGLQGSKYRPPNRHR